MKSETGTATLIAAAMALGGCASNPEDIAAIRVAPAQYENADCHTLARLQASNETRLDSLDKALRDRSRNDAVAAGGGLLFPPAFLLVRGDGDARLEFAERKGTKAALAAAAIDKNCG